MPVLLLSCKAIIRIRINDLMAYPDAGYLCASAAGTGTAEGASDSSNVVGAGEHLAGAHETFIQVEQLQKGLCGVSRPHFFRGVATVSQTW